MIYGRKIKTRILKKNIPQDLKFPAKLVLQYHVTSLFTNHVTFKMVDMKSVLVFLCFLVSVSAGPTPVVLWHGMGMLLYIMSIELFMCFVFKI